MSGPTIPEPGWGTPLGVEADFADCVSIEPVFASPLLRVSHWCCRFDGRALRQERYNAWHVLALPRSGASMIHSGGRSKLVAPGSAVLRAPFTLYSSSHPFGCGDCGWNIAIRQDALPATDGASEPPSFRIGPVPLRDFARWRLELERQRRERSAPLGLEEATLRLLAAVMGSLEPAGSARPPRRSSTAEAHEACFERTRAELFRRFREPLQLADLARAVHTSPFHLCRIFKRASGLPVHRYLTRLRLLEGLEALVEQDVPLAGLALDLGFSSHSHFTDAFRCELGMAPSELRRLAAVERAARVRQARRTLQASLL